MIEEIIILICLILSITGFYILCLIVSHVIVEWLKSRGFIVKRYNRQSMKFEYKWR